MLRYSKALKNEQSAAYLGMVRESTMNHYRDVSLLLLSERMAIILLLEDSFLPMRDQIQWHSHSNVTCKCKTRHKNSLQYLLVYRLVTMLHEWYLSQKDFAGQYMQKVHLTPLRCLHCKCYLIWMQWWICFTTCTCLL